MYRRERYFDKNDRSKNQFGQEKEYLTKDKVNDDDEITVVIDKNEESKNTEKETAP